MTIYSLHTLEIIETMENFITQIRPPEHIREELDFAYRIENQSVIVFEKRPMWNNPAEKIESDFAKATFVKTNNHWKIFWMRSDLKWHSYKPNPTAKTLRDFCKLINEDEHGCFFG